MYYIQEGCLIGETLEHLHGIFSQEWEKAVKKIFSLEQSQILVFSMFIKQSYFKN